MSEEKTMTDYLGSGEQPSLWEKISWKLKNLDYNLRKIVWFFQWVFRPYHASDCDIWNLSHHLARVILSKLRAFRKYPLHGYPAAFCEYHENEWKSREEYDEALKKGDIVGGEMEAWLDTLDKMIFAFELVAEYDTCESKLKKRFLERYNLKDPAEECEENRSETYVYKSIDEDGEEHRVFSTEKIENEPDKEYLGSAISYFNIDLERSYWERAQEGLKLFAKYFMNLWD